MKKFVIIFFLLCCNLVIAQERDVQPDSEYAIALVDEWVNGMVYLKDGSVLKSEFSYNYLLPEGLLKIKKGGVIKTETVKTVDGFIYYDEKLQRDREFISMALLGQRKFIEILYEGNQYSVIGRKDYLKTKFTIEGGSYANLIPIYIKYIIRHQTGEILKVPTKHTLLNIFADKRKELKAFMKKYLLEFERNEDVVSVVKKYEELSIISTQIDE